MRSTPSAVFAHRSLLFELIRTELAVAQHRNRLGWMWWLVDPLIFIGIFWIFKTILLGGEAYAPYPIFVGSALIAWRFFTTVISRSSTVIQSRASLIRSVAFPLAILPLSKLFAECVFFLIALVLLIGVAWLFDVPLGWSLLQLLALFVIQVLLAAGLSLLAAGIGILIFDFSSIAGHLLRVIFYLSPVIYGSDLVVRRFGEDSIWTWLFVHSPFALLYEGYRGALWSPRWMQFDSWAWLIGESVVAFVVGAIVFNRLESNAVKMMQ